MATKQRQGRTGKHHAGGGVRGSSDSVRVGGLRRSFAKFRREHEPRTRIPHSLRNAALCALQSGIPEFDVRRACGVTSDQLTQWRKRAKACTQKRGPEALDARVFPVVADMASSGVPHAGGHVEQELELRIGGWAVCVRQVEA